MSCSAGLDGRFVSPSVFPVTCSLGTWLLTLGFSLSYGAMFSKIWRVHRITRMTKEEGKTVSSQPNHRLSFSALFNAYT